MKATATCKQLELKNVLFATDFSDSAFAAMPFAKAIAKRRCAHLFVLSVRPQIVNPMTPPATWSSVEAAAKVAEEEKRAQLADEFAGFHAEILLPEGDVQTLLPELVHQKKIDLVVIGTRGRSGLNKFFMGSTAEALLRLVSCPVLTVGPRAAVTLAADGGPRKILYATDFAAESELAASYAISLAAEFQANLTLVHCAPDPTKRESLNSERLQEHYRNQLRSLVPAEAEAFCNVEYLVQQGPAAEGILAAAKGRKADLIVLGARPETGFPGAASHLPVATAHQVLRHATCPVLTICH